MELCRQRKTFWLKSSKAYDFSETSHTSHVTFNTRRCCHQLVSHSTCATMHTRGRPNCGDVMMVVVVVVVVDCIKIEKQ